MMAERLATTFGFARDLLVIPLIGWIAYRRSPGG
jgi:hypothetical protein